MTAHLFGTLGRGLPVQLMRTHQGEVGLSLVGFSWLDLCLDLRQFHYCVVYQLQRLDI